MKLSLQKQSVFPWVIWAFLCNVPLFSSFMFFFLTLIQLCSIFQPFSFEHILNWAIPVFQKGSKEKKEKKEIRIGYLFEFFFFFQKSMYFCDDLVDLSWWGHIFFLIITFYFQKEKSIDPYGCTHPATVSAHRVSAPFRRWLLTGHKSNKVCAATCYHCIPESCLLLLLFKRMSCKGKVLTDKYRE